MLSFFTGIGGKIAGGVGLVLLLAIGILTWQLHSAHDTIDDLKVKVTQTEDKLKVSNSSLLEANQHITANNLRIEQANADLQKAKETAAANEARLREQYKSTSVDVAAIEAEGRDTKRPVCTVSPATKKALEELSE